MDFLTHNRNLILTLVILVLLVALLMNGMSAPTAVSILLSGVTLAALYFLVASGISIIFGLMDVLNFAHGSFFMLGAYLRWTFYTNPRLILNTAPLLLALTAAVSLNSLLTRRVTVPAVGRWIAALVAVIIVVLGMRNFPIENLVAMGMSMTGKVIPTAEAQEPLATMFNRMALFFLAGLALDFAIASNDRDRRLPTLTRTLATAVVLALAGVLTLVLRDIGEQVILGTESNMRFILALLFGGAMGALLGALMEWGL